jgi:hypothetical protein
VKKKKTTPTEADETVPPITSLSYKFCKIDMGTLLIMLLASSDSTMPTSIKFWQCDLEPNSIKLIADILSLQRSHINKIFINYNYWNTESEFSVTPSPYLELFKPELRLKMLSLTYCNLTDDAVASFL